MRSITAALIASMKRHPERASLRDGEFVLTFAEVHERAARLGGALRASGVAPGDRVMISMGVCAQGVIAVLGALFAGAVVAPTNPAAKRRELLHWAELVRPSAIIAAGEPLEQLRAGDDPGELDGLRWVIDGSDGGRGDLDLAEAIHQGEACDGPEPRPSDPALILFTSGTTGLSKGVTRTHGTLLAFLDHWERRVVQPEDVVLNFLPLNHQAGLLLSVLGPMCLGAEVVLLPQFTPESFWRAVLDHRVTWTVTMPPVPGLLVAAADAGGASGAGHRLRGTLGAGPAEDWRAFEAGHRVGMITGYGSTESTMVTMSPTGQIAGDRLTPALGGSFCGAPVPGWTRVRVAGPDGVPTAPGEIGDIQLSGGGLFTEYWNNPDATARAFTEDGWFRTGDLGYLSAESDLYLIGRADDRIRRNGENIDPVEVETVLKEHPAVADAGLVGIPDARRGAEVLACVVPASGRTVSFAELVEHCRGQLSSFKVPRYLEFRSELPRTNGTFRIQRGILREQADPATWYDRYAEQA
jgi:acyl-CoA synthetase (AMP-forming)/AMP-acid ligase II